MRGVLLAIALLSVPVAGCLGLTGPDVTIEKPHLTQGTLFTYRIDAGEVDGTQTLVVLPSGDGYELEPYNVTESFNSPYLHLSPSLNPTVFNWSGVLNWPLEDGKSYQATVGGAEATVELSAIEDVEGPDGPTDAVRAVATQDSRQLAEIVVLQNPTVVQRIDLDAPDGTDETWELEEVGFHARFDQSARWETGDWWTYNATTRGSFAQTQLVYNANDTTQKGALEYVLNPTQVADRFASLPFMRFKASNLAPQSGYLTGLVSSFWDWPLHDGKQWSGSTSLSGVQSYQAVASLDTGIRLPDGTLTTGYTIELYPSQRSSGDPIGAYQYVPRVQMLTYAWLEDPGTGDRPIDWELVDWGEGYHGEMEYPHVVELLGVNRTSGPTEVSRTFTVPEPAERVQLKMAAVRQPDAGNTSFTLLRPDNSVALEINETRFRDRFLQVNEATEAVNGTWRLQAELPEGVSFFGEVNALWSETVQVDYR